MKKNYLLSLLFLLISSVVIGQNYNMTNGANGTISTCSGNFRDGGGNGNYANNQSSTITFCPSTPGTVIRLTFTSFDTEIIGTTVYDYLEMWQGATITGAAFDTFAGTPTVPFTVTSSSPDGCLTFRFTSDSSVNRAGWNATISCVVPCTAATSPVANMVDTSPVTICPPSALNPGSTTVAFNASNSTNGGFTNDQFTWDWGDGTTSVTATPTTTHTYPTTPGIYMASVKVRNSNGCFSTNYVSRKIQIQPEPNFTGTTTGPVAVSCGNSVTLNGLAVSQTISETAPTVSGSPVLLPDGSGASYLSTLNFSGMFPAGATMSPGCYPTLNFSIEHSFSGDLQIDLIAPSGQSVRVFDRHGGWTLFGTCANAADNLVPGCPANYTVVNSGGVNWTAAGNTTTATANCAGYAGACEAGNYYIPQTYNSTNSFAALNGAALNGTWTLRIYDQAALDDGFISGWSLVFPSACFGSMQSDTPDLTTATWSTTGSGPAVPAQTTTSTVVNNPGPSCPAPGPCVGNQLSNNVTIGPFTSPGSYVYSFTVTDENGCQYRRNVTVNATCSCPTASISYPGSPFCNVAGTQAVTITGTGVYTGGTYSAPAGLSIDSATGEINTGASTPGTYTVTYNYNPGGGCPVINITTPVTINSNHTIAAGSNQAVCINSPITPINMTIGGGATGATVTGLPTGLSSSVAGTTLTISGTPTVSGTFNYNVTTTGNACAVATTSGTITVTAQNTIATGTSQTVCVNNAITTITLATTGATGATITGLPTGVTGSWAGNVVTISGTPTVSGTFNYTVTTTGGCPPATTTGTITVTAQNTIEDGISETVCINNAITPITLATTGATGATITGLPTGVTGSWAGNVVTISGTPTVSGTFNYTVTTTGGCPPATTTGILTVSSAIVPVTGFSYATPICQNEANPMPNEVSGFTAGGTYSSTAGLVFVSTTTGEIDLAASTPGTYIVEYLYPASSCGVEGSSTFEITITALPVIALTSDVATASQTICENESIVAITYEVSNATGATVTGLPAGVTSNFASGIVTITGTPTAVGVYNFTVSTTGGCSPSATAVGTIVVNVLPLVPAINTVSPTCTSDGISAIANYDGGMTYVFTPSGPSVDGTGLISGMVVGTAYTVVADNGNCTSGASVSFSNGAMLTTPSVPTINTVSPTCTSDGISTIANYDGGMTYVFTPSGPSVDATGLISGMVVGTAYTVVADNGSCASLASVSFSNGAMLTTPSVPAINTVLPTCTSDGISTIANYDAGITYVFTPAGPSVDATGLISGMIVGTAYTVVADNGSCTSGASVSFSNELMLTTLPTPDINTVSPTCTSDGISTIANYDGAVTYVFSPAGPSVDATGLISGMVVGTAYTVVADNGSCASLASVSFSNGAMLTTPSEPTIATVLRTCISDGSSTIANYDGGVTYIFTPSGPSVDATGLISGMVVGTAYTVVADNGSCASLASVSFSNGAMLTTPSVPIINTVLPTCTSDGISTIANYDAGVTYVFTPSGPSVDATGLISGMVVGTSYTVVADNGNCTSGASVSFSNGAMLTAPSVPTIDTDLPTCTSDGISTIANYDGAVTYVFTPSGPSVDATGLISDMVAGTAYTVVADNGSCISAMSASFSIEPMIIPPIVTFTGSCAGGAFTLVADQINPSYSYEWLTSSGISIGTSSSQVITSAGTYTLEVDTGNGCISSYSNAYTTILCEIPKGISPNGDNLNDNWDIEGLNAKSVKIFNRYGTTVYEHGAGYTNQWHGQSKNGNELPDGTYYYVVESGDGQTRTGWVYINRER
ncbi:T9SS C-terminal target domain-containing protein [Flavobacterium suncheonense]|uniref:T9SS C-terminal target domain-containing protein n=1 Tax=Flavobacterium suncheonense TaxID=350894 RepID=UPI00047BC492|nr:T9SS C-terminal target domain-containing protein [Flavobacterium suncheonense]